MKAGKRLKETKYEKCTQKNGIERETEKKEIGLKKITIR